MANMNNDDQEFFARLGAEPKCACGAMVCGHKYPGLKRTDPRPELGKRWAGSLKDYEKYQLGFKGYETIYSYTIGIDLADGSDKTVIRGL